MTATGYQTLLACLNKRLDTSIFGIVITTQDTRPSLLDSKYIRTTIWILDMSGFPMVTRCLVLKCFNFWTSSKNRTKKSVVIFLDFLAYWKREGVQNPILRLSLCWQFQNLVTSYNWLSHQIKRNLYLTLCEIQQLSSKTDLVHPSIKLSAKQACVFT